MVGSVVWVLGRRAGWIVALTDQVRSVLAQTSRLEVGSHPERRASFGLWLVVGADLRAHVKPSLTLLVKRAPWILVF